VRQTARSYRAAHSCACDVPKAGLDRAIANGWLMLHERGTFVKFTQEGADLFA
jgi:hypothetical protein